MRVFFENGYEKRIWIVVSYLDDDFCEEEPNHFAVEGWWSLEPNKDGWMFSSTNKFCAFFAMSDDGLEWVGDLNAFVPMTAFKKCLQEGSTNSTGGSEERRIGMRIFELPGERWNPLASFTMRLVK